MAIPWRRATWAFVPGASRIYGDIHPAADWIWGWQDSQSQFGQYDFWYDNHPNDWLYVYGCSVKPYRTKSG